MYEYLLKIWVSALFIYNDKDVVSINIIINTTTTTTTNRPPFPSIPSCSSSYSTILTAQQNHPPSAMKSVKFDPDKDIPSLDGKVILVTGGKQSHQSHQSHPLPLPSEIQHTGKLSLSMKSYKVPPALGPRASSNSPNTIQNTSTSPAATTSPPPRPSKTSRSPSPAPKLTSSNVTWPLSFLSPPLPRTSRRSPPTSTFCSAMQASWPTRLP